MKVEIRVNNNEEGGQTCEKALQPVVAGEIAIDLAQVLAANQALLKNLNKKIESIESRIRSFEGQVISKFNSFELAAPQRLMLAMPPREIKPWQPSTVKVNDEYLEKFSWIDRIFFPDRMRRCED